MGHINILKMVVRLSMPHSEWCRIEELHETTERETWLPKRFIRPNRISSQELVTSG